MSYYEDQEEAWFENDCKGNPGDYDPYDVDSWPGNNSAANASDSQNKILTHLLKAVEGKGLKAMHRGNGHFQIRAERRTINWYPLSKRQTAYDNLTGTSRYRLSIEEVVAFALEKTLEERDTRK